MPTLLRFMGDETVTPTDRSLAEAKEIVDWFYDAPVENDALLLRIATALDAARKEKP